MAAGRGGAQRIELCSNTREGGTTPAPELLKRARQNVSLPIFSMVRPRSGDFFYSAAEFSEMLNDVDMAKEFQMDGVVLGLLDADGKVDVARTKLLVERARPLPVTFHRAFDECADLPEALEDVIQTGARRLLTSGGKRTAPEGLKTLGQLVRIAAERLIVLPGSGLHAWNIQDAVRKTGAREFHAGLSSVVPAPAENLLAFEQAVRDLAVSLRDCD